MDLRTYIYAELDKAIDGYKDSIIAGHYTYEEYKKACGYAAGLQLAKDIIEETYRKYLTE
jgi:hypothetical protein